MRNPRFIQTPHLVADVKTLEAFVTRCGKPKKDDQILCLVTVTEMELAALLSCADMARNYLEMPVRKTLKKKAKKA